MRERVTIRCFCKRFPRETFVTDTKFIEFLQGLDNQRVMRFEHFDKSEILTRLLLVSVYFELHT